MYKATKVSIPLLFDIRPFAAQSAHLGSCRHGTKTSKTAETTMAKSNQFLVRWMAFPSKFLGFGMVWRCLMMMMRRMRRRRMMMMMMDTLERFTLKYSCLNVIHTCGNETNGVWTPEHITGAMFWDMQPLQSVPCIELPSPTDGAEEVARSKYRQLDNNLAMWKE